MFYNLPLRGCVFSAVFDNLIEFENNWVLQSLKGSSFASANDFLLPALRVICSLICEGLTLLIIEF